MYTIKDYIQEKYSPAFNRNHRSLIEGCMNLIDNAVKAKSISKEDVISMIEDLLNTYKKEYNLE